MCREPATAACRGRLWPAFALAFAYVLALVAPPAGFIASAAAQTTLAQAAGQNSLFSTAPSTNLLTPNEGTRGNMFTPGDVLAPPSAPLMLSPGRGAGPVPMVPAGQVALALAAHFGKEAPSITGGLIWRIYAARPDARGKFRLIKEEKTAAPTVVLPAGDYIVNVCFGLATAARPVSLRGPTVHEVFDLPAGGLRLEGKVGDVRIPAGQISFDVYKGSQFETGPQRPIAEHVMTGQVVVVPEGVYHVVSKYGDANAMVRSDIRVQAGKLTDITVNHRAAAITLKLVTEKGGEALANTAWAVLNPGGDVIKEMLGAFPRVILSEGEYSAIARNEGKVYERKFKVVAGVDGDVEVMAR